jgi:hypothetical protein
MSRVRVALLLICTLASFYMLTYSGQIEIADQLDHFDGVSSLATFGDVKFDQSMWQPGSIPRNFVRNQPDPLRDSDLEPGLLLVAAPLYALAERLDGVGLVHTVYLFNVFMTALLCGIFFWYALILRYSIRIAVIGALCLGLLTTLFPYSQTFFREQLMMVFLLTGAVLLEVFRDQNLTPLNSQTARAQRAAPLRIRILYLLLALALIVFAFRTKDATILAVPGLLLIISPERLWRNRLVQRLSDVLLIGLIVAAVLIAYTDVLRWLNPNNATVPLIGAFVLETEFTRTALHTYLFSLGGSLWGTSPILLLALPGAYLLWKRGDRRILWVGVMIVFSYTFGYALLRGVEWFGGTIWPQRFLLPALPFAMFLVLPMLKAIFERENNSEIPRLFQSRFWLPVFVLLAIYSAWWQFSGVSYRWHEYSEATFELSNGGLAYWGPGFNDVRYIRPVVLAGFWGEKPLNFAWVRTEQWSIPLLFALFIIACGYGLYRILDRRAARLAIVAPVILIALTYLTLRLIYIDPAYKGENEALHQMLNVVREEVEPGEQVLLADREYNDFFLNYGRLGTRRVIGFPFHPGDRASCDQPLRVVSENPEALLEPYSAPTIHHLANAQPRLWLLLSSGPEIPCVVRPMERLMGMRYYRVSEHETAPAVRLLEFQTADAPDPFLLRGAEIPSDLRFETLEGGEMALTGLSLPEGTTYQAGNWLPLSIRWQSDDELTRDYTVAWFLADESGVKAQGEDTWHGATFFPTSLWREGIPIWDNRALRLPADLPSGEYQLWVKVYWQDINTGAITDLPVSGERTGDATVGVLPVTITVE